MTGLNRRIRIDSDFDVSHECDDMDGEGFRLHTEHIEAIRHPWELDERPWTLLPDVAEQRERIRGRIRDVIHRWQESGECSCTFLVRCHSPEDQESVAGVRQILEETINGSRIRVLRCEPSTVRLCGDFEHYEPGVYIQLAS